MGNSAVLFRLFLCLLLFDSQLYIIEDLMHHSDTLDILETLIGDYTFILDKALKSIFLSSDNTSTYQTPTTIAKPQGTIQSLAKPLPTINTGVRESKSIEDKLRKLWQSQIAGLSNLSDQSLAFKNNEDLQRYCLRVMRNLKEQVAQVTAKQPTTSRQLTTSPGVNNNMLSLPSMRSDLKQSHYAVTSSDPLRDNDIFTQRLYEGLLIFRQALDSLMKAASQLQTLHTLTPSPQLTALAFKVVLSFFRTLQKEVSIILKPSDTCLIPKSVSETQAKMAHTCEKWVLEGCENRIRAVKMLKIVIVGGK